MLTTFTSTVCPAYSLVSSGVRNGARIVDTEVIPTDSDAVRNPVTEKVEIENDTIKSKRGDHHGIGLLNVKAVVDKYGGDMVLSCDENEFKAVVIL